jgi:hypothetical protein
MTRLSDIQRVILSAASGRKDGAVSSFHSANVPGLLPPSKISPEMSAGGSSREPPAWPPGPLGLRTDAFDEEVCEDGKIQGASAVFWAENSLLPGDKPPVNLEKSPRRPVNYPVSRETEPQNCQTETDAAIPVQRPRGDGLRRPTWALKPRNSGVFRECPGIRQEPRLGGGGRGTVVEPSLARFQWLRNHTDFSGC